MTISLPRARLAAGAGPKETGIALPVAIPALVLRTELSLLTTLSPMRISWLHICQRRANNTFPSESPSNARLRLM